MNIKRKSAMQEKHILSMQKQIERLKKENDALRSKNQELLNTKEQHQVQLNMINELRDELMRNIAEINGIKEQYQQLTYDARQVKKDFMNKAKPLIKQLKLLN